MEKLFKLKAKGTNVRTEIIAGLTTFLTMAYILGVNPGMLSATGMPFQSVFLATAISSAVACLVMGLAANYPVALAPGMGVNAFFTYTVVLGGGYTWQEALAAVLVSGVAFLIISVTGVRKAVIKAIPGQLRLAIGAGIGFFIALIGFVNAGIVRTGATILELGDIKNPTVLLSVFGLFLTIALIAAGLKAAVFYGLVGTAVVGVVMGLFGIGGMPAIPTAIASVSFDFSTFGACFSGFKTLFTHKDIILVLFVFLFVDFFDTAGTLIAVAQKTDLIKEDGELENVDKAMFADAVGTVVGAVCGTSTVTSFIESSTGVEAGGRTGLTAVTTGVLFIASIFFMPLLSVVGSIPVDGAFLSPVTSPALICVGIFMAQQLKLIEWDKLALAATAFMTVITMVISYKISDGIAVGFITYALAMAASGKAKQVKPTMWLLCALFITYFVFTL